MLWNALRLLHMKSMNLKTHNGKQWEFCISAMHIGLENGYVMLNERNFILWAKRQMEIE